MPAYTVMQKSMHRHDWTPAQQCCAVHANPQLLCILVQHEHCLKLESHAA
jgi:hypothetical protein